MEKPIARATVRINAPTERVWNALVDPNAIKQYMFGAQVHSDWQEGSCHHMERRVAGEALMKTKASCCA
jgi:uncharacterized protein YndB with AHSA1/START domain